MTNFFGISSQDLHAIAMKIAFLYGLMLYVLAHVLAFGVEKLLNALKVDVANPPSYS